MTVTDGRASVIQACGIVRRDDINKNKPLIGGLILDEHDALYGDALLFVTLICAPGRRRQKETTRTPARRGSEGKNLTAAAGRRKKTIAQIFYSLIQYDTVPGGDTYCFPPL